QMLAPSRRSPTRIRTSSPPIPPPDLRSFPTRRSSDLWRWCRRKPMAAALAMTMLALVGLASGGGVWIAQQSARHDLDLRNGVSRSEEHTSELQSPCNLVCRLLLEKKNKNNAVARRASD